MNPKSLPDRKDKLMDRARLGMLVGYANTDKQYQIWAPDIQKVIRASSVRFDESKSLRLEELRLPAHTENSSGMAPIRNPVGRPPKLGKSISPDVSAGQGVSKESESPVESNKKKEEPSSGSTELSKMSNL